MFTFIALLVLIGVIGYLVVTYIPMIEPIRTVVVIAFALVAIYYLVKIIGLVFGVALL